jgi:N-(2-amino-2-carboxyethyl)-L-glutamate synthase
VREIVSQTPGIVWLNQYANRANMRAHAETTAREILREFPKLNWLFVGTGTTGTFMGCSQHLREHSPGTIVAAVEPKGSVTFGGTAGRRHIPGLGTSRAPELVDPTCAGRLIYIEEATTVNTCNEILQRYGLLVGGSTGTVLAGVRALQNEFAPDDAIVAISPDMGDKYLDTIYDDDWVNQRIFCTQR